MNPNTAHRWVRLPTQTLSPGEWGYWPKHCPQVSRATNPNAVCGATDPNCPQVSGATDPNTAHRWLSCVAFWLDHSLQVSGLLGGLSTGFFRRVMELYFVVQNASGQLGSGVVQGHMADFIPPPTPHTPHTPHPNTDADSILPAIERKGKMRTTFRSPSQNPSLCYNQVHPCFLARSKVWFWN